MEGKGEIALTAYYNENDKNAAQWLRNLIAAGLIAPGDVDDRSIEDVRPSDLIGYDQCHFFAGIGVWSHALRRAGWSDDRPIWTGSCPCQPFSAAGQGGGFADERHLWPAWQWLITRAKPRGVPVLGEQVASPAGLAWFDVVQADLEGQGYTVRSADLCAAGVGAPHIRQRLFFVADTDGRDASAEGLQRGRQHGLEQEDRRAGRLADADGKRGGGHAGAVPGAQGSAGRGAQGSAGRGVRGVADGVEPSGAAGTVANDNRDGCEVGSTPRVHDRGQSGHDADGRGAVGGMEQPGGQRRERREAPASGHDHDRAASQGPQGQHGTGVPGTHRGAAAGDVGDAASERRARLGDQPEHPRAGQTGPVNGFWHNAVWLPCIDGKARPIEPGSFPLVDGAHSRVVRLRAYGNAIVAPLAEEFIRAYIEESALARLR